MKMKNFALATTALVGSLIATSAFAQSTASTELDSVVITAATGPKTVGGMLNAETVAKSRATVSQEFLATQVPGQTVIQSLSILVPGLNFTNNDAYGSSGGNIRLHGFDGNRVALTFDGMPLNDTGNYATYTNQLPDSEIIAYASVNTGSTDVDSPTAASTGGTIGISTLTPSKEASAWAQASVGTDNYRRFAAFAETGEFGPWGTRMWVEGSYQKYDKFKGEGEIYKRQINAKVYQPIGDNGDFVSLAAHYNVNRNNAYYGPNLRTATASLPNEVDTAGWGVDFATTYASPTVTTPTGVTGDVDVDAGSSSYYGLRINPSNTGNLRGQSRFTLGHGLTFTFDPSFQYTLANGGTQNATLTETNAQLRGTATTGGVDLNKDGDLNDTVRVMTPSNTNTRRYGVLTSLIWKLNENNAFRIGYTLDYGRHRQTGEYSTIDFGGSDGPRYTSWFGGKDGHGEKIKTVDGKSFMRARDRFSIATLNQVSAEYRGKFLDDKLNLSIGVRAPFFKRELNQFCYSQNGSSSVRCTTETPNNTLPNGNVTFAATGSTQYIAPYSKTLKYDDVLPNIGGMYRLNDHSQLYASYAGSTSLPRTDNLYTVLRLANGTVGNSTVQPETSNTFEGGYRYQTSQWLVSVSAWNTKFENRIVSSYDQDLGINIDRNVGEVKQWGVDASAGFNPTDYLTAYFSVSYNDSELQDNIAISSTTFAATKGKEIVETPHWTFSNRMEVEPVEGLTLGVQTKYVSSRWATDVNDLKVGSYVLTDLDAKYSLKGMGFENSFIQANVSNLFDKKYYGNLGTQTSATPGAPGYGRPFANIGSPRTFTLTLRAGF
ncbi:TonB-dependent receptor [Caulobacter segnis]|uniref:TonB-dependent receptor n=2 Tax=Caulobacter segnis TaxID=88688 RepID=D5VPD8_CAUST|nr:TonB-dependent receptor [Caulobacter segnis]ADG12361.1 TonB-dependent receptor [Caulobacter segnis ATCC 21756]AVQ03949.1 TonB-dependent receptor [Caulobacter segnis]